MFKLILICCAFGLLFYLRKSSGNTSPTDSDQDFEDNFLNGASGKDIDDF